MTVAQAPRADAWGKATGRARYTHDIDVPGMLHGFVVRSERAGVEIREVELEAARGMPGVLAVLGPDDVPDVPMGIVEPDERVLARERTRYLGEPVALIAASTLDEARAAGAAVRITYGAEMPVVRLQEALTDDAPAVGDGPNRKLISHFSRGQVDEVLAGAETVIETTVRSHRVHQAYIELRCSLAELDDEGRLVVTTTSQAPFQVRKTLADVFDLPMTRVVVRVPTFGGGFGGKLHNGMAPYAAALALATRRPVQVVCGREDDMRSGNPREASEVSLTSAVDSDGRILARRAALYLDSGAYTYDTPYITSMGAMQSGGAYTVDAIEGSGYAVSTNMAASASFRSPSGPQMAFANETHLEEIAQRLGLDPIDVRRRNLMRAGTAGPTGQPILDDAAEAILDRGCAVLDEWRSAPATADRPFAIGHGLALTWWFTAPGGSSATVRMEEDGSATVACGATEIGTGAVVSGLRELVAGDLGLTIDRVRMITASTDSAPPDFGSEGSRTLYGAGNAVLRASAEVRRILAEKLAQELEADPDDVVFEHGQVQIAGSPQTAVGIAALVGRAALASGPVVGSGRFQAPPTEYVESCAAGMLLPTFNEPTFHCHVAEIVVDLELGAIEVPRYAAIHDTGTVVDAAGVKGQIEGGVIQGVGQALYEEMLVGDDGSIRNASLVDYRLPTIADVPGELRVISVQDFPSRTGPRGVKGIGEAPIILPGAALACALHDATGVRMKELPLTADRVRAALRAAGVSP